MSSPLKPWEKAEVSSSNNMRTGVASSVIDNMSSPSLSAQRSMPTTSILRDPPQVPTRNYISQQSQFCSGYNGYGFAGSGYGAVGTGYGSGALYSPFSGMNNGVYSGFGMNRWGSGSFAPGSFSQQAELSSRQAFQSVESVVHAVGSVAALLDATFQAIYNSFRAVIGVADHMSRIRVHLTQIFSSLAVIRTLRWFMSWLLSFLRLQKLSTTDDQLWSRAAEQVTVDGAAEIDVSEQSQSNWPIMIFFAIIVGGPWLIWKFLSSFTATAGTNEWATGAADHYVAVAEFDFRGQNGDELSFEQGTMINIAPKAIQPHVRGWLLGSIDGQSFGLIPANYVRILGKRHGTKRTDTKPDLLAGQQQTCDSSVQQISCDDS